MDFKPNRGMGVYCTFYPCTMKIYIELKYVAFLDIIYVKLQFLLLQFFLSTASATCVPRTQGTRSRGANMFKYLHNRGRLLQQNVFLNEASLHDDMSGVVDYILSAMSST